MAFARNTRKLLRRSISAPKKPTKLHATTSSSVTGIEREVRRKYINSMNTVIARPKQTDRPIWNTGRSTRKAMMSPALSAGRRRSISMEMPASTAPAPAYAP